MAHQASFRPTRESEFAGIRVRQQRDFSMEVDLEDNTNNFITEAPITHPKTEQRQERTTEFSRVQHVARCARRCVLEGSTNVSPVCRRCEYAVECHSSSSCARSWTQTYLSGTCVSVLHRLFVFHSLNGTLLQQLVWGSWAAASDRPRPELQPLPQKRCFGKVKKTMSA